MHLFRPDQLSTLKAVVTYSCGSMRQNVHSKETWEQPDVTVPEFVKNSKVEVAELVKNSLTTSVESGKIKSENQKRLQQMIDEGTVSTTINAEMQNRHFLGTYEYLDFLARGIEESYYLKGVTIDDLQQYLTGNAATGEVFIFYNGKTIEIIDTGEQNAYDILNGKVGEEGLRYTISCHWIMRDYHVQSK